MNELNSTVDVLQWSKGDGSLTLVTSIELLPAGQGVTVRSYAECTPANISGRLVWGLARRSVTDLLDFCDRYLQRKEAGRVDPVPVPKGFAEVALVPFMMLRMPA